MIASPHGGVNIEEIARTNPSAILKEPVDIMDGEYIPCQHVEHVYKL